jgi:hypothetical protein
LLRELSPVITLPFDLPGLEISHQHPHVPVFERLQPGGCSRCEVRAVVVGHDDAHTAARQQQSGSQFDLAEWQSHRHRDMARGVSVSFPHINYRDFVCIKHFPSQLLRRDALQAVRFESAMSGLRV